MRKILNYFLNKRWVLHIVMCFLSNEKKEKIYLEKIKAEFAFWGHDVSDITDEEIKEGINNMGEIVKECGTSINEVSQAFKTFVKLNLTSENSQFTTQTNS